MYGRIVDGAGWTFNEIDDLTLSDVEMLFLHWSEEPPLAMCVRAWIGVKPADAGAEDGGNARPQKVEMTQEEWNEMVAGMKANAELYGRRRN